MAEQLTAGGLEAAVLDCTHTCSRLLLGCDIDLALLARYPGSSLADADTAFRRSPEWQAFQRLAGDYLGGLSLDAGQSYRDYITRRAAGWAWAEYIEDAVCLVVFRLRDWRARHPGCDALRDPALLRQLAELYQRIPNAATQMQFAQDFAGELNIPVRRAEAILGARQRADQGIAEMPAITGRNHGRPTHHASQRGD